MVLDTMQLPTVAGNIYILSIKQGLFIASRVPLKSVEYVEFNPDRRVLTERGYIKARVSSITSILKQKSYPFC